MRDFIKQEIENFKYLLDVHEKADKFSSGGLPADAIASLAGVLDGELARAADKLKTLIEQTNTQYGSID